jgi:ethanolamine transporter EutH
MLFIIRHVEDAATLTSLAGTYTAVIGIFLGVDLAAMVHKTHNLKPGDYKEICISKYLSAMFLFCVLILRTFLVQREFDRQLNGLYLCFGVGFLIVIGGLVTGIEANKIATDQGPKRK